MRIRSFARALATIALALSMTVTSVTPAYASSIDVTDGSCHDASVPISLTGYTAPNISYTIGLPALLAFTYDEAESRYKVQLDFSVMKNMPDDYAVLISMPNSMGLWDTTDGPRDMVNESNDLLAMGSRYNLGNCPEGIPAWIRHVIGTAAEEDIQSVHRYTDSSDNGIIDQYVYHNLANDTLDEYSEAFYCAGTAIPGHTYSGSYYIEYEVAKITPIS